MTAVEPNRSLTSYDNDYSRENPTYYMNANVSFATNTATVVIRRPNGRDSHTLRDRNLGNDPPCR